jgi:hypothetical protein
VRTQRRFWKTGCFAPERSTLLHSGLISKTVARRGFGVYGDRSRAYSRTEVATEE